MLTKKNLTFNQSSSSKTLADNEYHQVAATQIKVCLSLDDIKNFKCGLKMIVTKNKAPVFFELDSFKNHQDQTIYYAFDFVNKKLFTKNL